MWYSRQGAEAGDELSGLYEILVKVLQMKNAAHGKGAQRNRGGLMRTSEQIKETLRDLFATQKLAVLSTHRDGQPYASLVSFVATEDLEYLFFVTGRATRKFANLKADSRAALLIDSRSHKDSDIHQAIGVTASGVAEEVKGRDRECFIRLYLAKHPLLEDFVKSPSRVLLRVKVDSYYVVSRFQTVMELHLRR